MAESSRLVRLLGQWTGVVVAAGVGFGAAGCLNVGESEVEGSPADSPAGDDPAGDIDPMKSQCCQWEGSVCLDYCEPETGDETPTPKPPSGTTTQCMQKASTATEQLALVRKYVQEELASAGIVKGQQYTFEAAGSAYKCKLDGTKSSTGKFNCSPWNVGIHVASAFNLGSKGEEVIREEQVAKASTKGCVVDACTGALKNTNGSSCTGNMPISLSIHDLTTSGKFVHDAGGTASGKSSLNVRLPFWDSKNSGTLAGDTVRQEMMDKCDDGWGGDMPDIAWCNASAVTYPEVMGWTDFDTDANTKGDLPGDGCFWIDLKGTRTVDGKKAWTFTLKASTTPGELEPYASEGIPYCGSSEVWAPPTDGASLPRIDVGLTSTTCLPSNLESNGATCSIDDDFIWYAEMSATSTAVCKNLGGVEEADVCPEVVKGVWATIAAQVASKFTTPDPKTGQTTLVVMKEALSDLLYAVLVAEGIGFGQVQWKGATADTSKGFVYSVLSIMPVNPGN